MKFRPLIAATLLLGSVSAHAVPVFIGSYDIFNGPLWTTNPVVLSAIEAAELNFGVPVNGFYEISTNGSDPNQINNSGWYDEIGIGPSIFAESFKRDLGPPGYNGGGWVSGDDVSGWVQDNCGQGRCINYVFLNRIPEPATAALLGLALVGFGLRQKRT